MRFFRDKQANPRCIKSSVWIVFMMAGLSAALSAAPTCVDGTLASYIALGPGGCTIGAFAFNNFAFPTPATAGNPTVATTSEIMVTPFNNSAGPGVSFSATVNQKNFFTLSTNGQPELVTYFIDYGIDPGAVIRGESLSIDPPFGDVTATQEYTLDDTGTTRSVVVSTNSQSSSVVFPFLVSNVGVETWITLQATLGHPAGFDGLDAGSSTQVIPEPAGARLPLAGLILLGGSLSIRRFRLNRPNA